MVREQREASLASLVDQAEEMVGGLVAVDVVVLDAAISIRRLFCHLARVRIVPAAHSDVSLLVSAW